MTDVSITDVALVVSGEGPGELSASSLALVVSGAGPGQLSVSDVASVISGAGPGQLSVSDYVVVMSFDAPDATPLPPGGLTYAHVVSNSVDVNMPALSTRATHLGIDRAPDVAGSPGTWARLNSDVTPSAPFVNGSLTPLTKYWYRAVAINLTGDTNGPQSSVTTLDVGPDQPTAPTFENIEAHTVDVVIPALVAHSTSYTLQMATDNFGTPNAYSAIATGLAPSLYHVTGLDSGRRYWFRFLAVGGGGSTMGEGSFVHTAGEIPVPVFTLATPGYDGADPQIFIQGR